MRDSFILYGFVGLMAINLLASFLYLIGLAPMLASCRRAYQTYTQKPR